MIATGETRSVRDFLDEVSKLVGMDWQKVVEIDERYFRPTEVDLLIGDSTKARRKLGWSPRTNFQELVHLMMKADLAEQGIGSEHPL